MVQEERSVLSEIEAAGAKFASAKQTQFNALGDLYCIYLRAKSTPDLKAEIEAAYKGLTDSGCPDKCKSLSGMVGWLAFPKSKQRVSDFHKICQFAPKDTKTAEQLSAWIAGNGGLRATLISHSKARNQAGGSGASKLSRSLTTALADLDANAKNRRTTASNPTRHDLTEGQKLFQVTEFRDGEYVVFEVLFDGEEVSFPSAVKTEPSVPAKAKPSLDALAAQGKSMSVQRNASAAVTS